MGGKGAKERAPSLSTSYSVVKELNRRHVWQHSLSLFSDSMNIMVHYIAQALFELVGRRHQKSTFVLYCVGKSSVLFALNGENCPFYVTLVYTIRAIALPREGKKESLFAGHCSLGRRPLNVPNIAAEIPSISRIIFSPRPQKLAPSLSFLFFLLGANFREKGNSSTRK